MLSIKDNKVFLKLNSAYYKKKEIDQTIAAFSEVCTAEKNEDTIILKPITEIEPKTLGLEFCNYVLSLK